MPDPCPLKSVTAPDEDCTLGRGHWGGCSFEPDETWRAIPDACPACNASNNLEIRQDLTATGLRTQYRCHNCGSSGPAMERPS